MADQIEETIRSLRSLGHSTDVDPGKVMRRVRAESERRCADGDTAYLGDLGIALLACHQAEPRAWQYLHAFDHLFRLLVGESGDRDLTQTLRLIAASRAAGNGIEALAAALLAQNLPQAAWAAASDGTGAAGDTFRACLVHELVLREGTVARAPKIVQWATSAAMRSHPLGRLPLALLDVEQGWDKGLGDPVEPDRQTMVVAGAQSLWPATDVTTGELSEALSAAVQNWADDSNGEIEAKVFDLGAPVTPANIASACPRSTWSAWNPARSRSGWPSSTSRRASPGGSCSMPPSTAAPMAGAGTAPTAGCRRGARWPRSWGRPRTPAPRKWRRWLSGAPGTASMPVPRGTRTFSGTSAWLPCVPTAAVWQCSPRPTRIEIGAPEDIDHTIELMFPEGRTAVAAAPPPPRFPCFSLSPRSAAATTAS